MKTRISIPIFVLLLSLLAGMARADITSGLVLYLPMDEASGSIAHDSTANHLDATLVNMPTDNSEWVPGFFGTALNFDTSKGTTQTAQVANNALLNFESTKTFSVALWVKIPATTANPTIIHKGISGSEQYIIDVNSAGNFRLYVRNSASTVTQIAATVAPNNTWQHVVAVFNQASSAMLLYVNGAQSASGTPPTSLKANTNPLNVGNRQTSTGFGNALNGTVDEVRVYNRALSLSDVQELYSFGRSAPPIVTALPVGASRYVGDPFSMSVTIDASSIYPRSYQWYQINDGVTNPVAGATGATLSFPSVQLTQAGTYSVLVSNAAGATNTPGVVLSVSPLPAPDITNGLVAYWTMNETSGSTAEDSSGNGNTGTLNNYLGDDSQWTTGVLSNALNNNNFASINEVVTVPDAPNLNFDTNSAPASAFTLSVWVQGTVSPTSQTNGSAIICKGYGGGGESYTIDYYNNAFRFYVRPFGGGASTPIQPGILANGLWQHLVGVFDVTNQIMWFYINGQLAGTANPPAAGVQWNSHEVSLGNRESSSSSDYNMPFWGHLDDVRIYNRALNSADVHALYVLAGVYPPSVAVQPQGATCYVGDKVTFSPTIGGTSPLTYKWLKNGAPVLDGGTGPSLTLANLQLSDAGSYSVQVSNMFGVTLSSNAVLQVSVFNISNTVAYWTFDEASGLNAADSSGGGNPAALINFPGDDSQWTAGRVAGGLAFNMDGSLSEVVTVPDSPAVNFYPGSAFSLAAWVRGSLSAQQSANPCIVCKGAGDTGAQYAIDVHGGAFRFYSYDMNGEMTPVQSSVVLSGRWQHVVATYDTNSMYLYVDGQLAASAKPLRSIPVLPTTHEVSIGSRESMEGWGYSLPFQGVIDDVRFYGRVISAADVQSLYAAAGPLPPCFYAQPQDASGYVGEGVTFSVVADGEAPLSYQWQKNGSSLAGATDASLTLTGLQLSDAGSYRMQLTAASSSLLSAAAVLQVLPAPAPDITNNLAAYWTFDETNGTNAADSSGNANSASLYGFPTDDSQWVSGVKGGALQFDSTGGNYVLTDNPLNGLLNGDQFTFSFWAKQNPGAHGVNPRFIGPLENSTVSGEQSWVVWSVAAGGVGFYPSAPSTEPSTTAWHHFVVEYDRLAATYTLYVDGSVQQVGVAAHTAPDVTSAPVPWVIGHSETLASASDSWNGLLDDLRVYNGRLLKVNDVRALYYAAAQPQLAVAQSGSSFSASWPVAALGYHLQKSDSVAGGTWTNVSTTPIVSADGLTQTVSDSAQAAARFYRLANP
jgi:hypothetical protein